MSPDSWEGGVRSVQVVVVEDMGSVIVVVVSSLGLPGGSVSVEMGLDVSVGVGLCKLS